MMNLEQIRKGIKLAEENNRKAKERFDKAEERERQYMTKVFDNCNVPSTHYEFTPIGSSERFDGYLTGHTQEAIFETKTRDVTSTTYPTTILHIGKVKYLQEKAIKENKQCLAFFTFTDNKWMVVEIDPYKDYPITKLPCPKTTMGDNEKVMSDVVEFKIKNLKNL